MQSKVIVIALDGATFTLLKPWMDQGHLPFLKSLVEEGVCAPLRSSIPPVTAPAWQCFMTGKNPGKHGVVWFMQRKPHSYEETLITPTSCKGRTFWELLSEDGKRVAVLNLPFTCPSPGLNGVMIGGFDALPSMRQEFTYPPGLLAKIESQLGEYRLTMKTPGFLVDRFEPVIEGFLTSCRELTDYQVQAAQYILDEDSFDFMVFYQRTTDAIQHRLWHILDPAYPSHDHELAGKFSGKILEYYRQLDQQIAKLVKKFGEDATVIVMSDHGFGPVTRGIDLNSWLLKQGYLAIKQRPISQIKYLLWKLGWGPHFFLNLIRRLLLLKPFREWFKRSPRRLFARRRVKDPTKLIEAFKRLFLSLNDLDWPRTKAYCQAGPGLIRLNIQGRDPQGSVRKEDYEALQSEIAAKLERLTDPGTSQPVEGRVFLREQIYQGKFLEDMPDMVYVSLGNCLIDNPFAFMTSKIATDALRISGYHRMEGIFIAKGPALKKGATIEGATIMDVAPTILYLMGSEIPMDMDGKVLTESFEEVFLKAHPIAYREADPEPDRPDVASSPEDQQAVLERLKGLGYID